jgi:putative peptidoglycan lipid II flippase
VALLLTVPSAVGLAVYGYPIMSIIYERGKFVSTDSAASALALACYAVGLSAYSCNKILVPVLYSLGKAGLAVTASVAAVIVNIIFCLVLVKLLGFAGLALGTSLGAYVNLFILLYGVNKYAGGLDWGSLFRGLFITLLSSAFLGAVLWFLWKELAPFWQTATFMLRLAILSAGLSLGAGTYWLSIRSLRMQEAKDIEGLLRRKLGSRRV